MPKKTTKKVTRKVAKKVIKKVAKKTKRKAIRKVVKKTRAKTKPKKSTDIIISSPVDPDIKVVVASELADDQMIESEMMGEVLPFFVYEFSQGGNKIRGLTVKGVSEAVRRLNRDKKSGYNIRVNPKYLKIEHNLEQENEKGVQVSVFAENLVDGNSAWGIKFEAYQKTGRNGKYKNDFAVEKALSKAERNAKRKLMPEVAVLKIIEKLMNTEQGSVKQIDAPEVRQQIVGRAPLKASDPEEIKQTIRNAIAFAKKSEDVILLDERTQKSDNFDKGFKTEVHSLASLKVGELDNDKK